MYSYVSPLIPSFKLSAVGPIFPATSKCLRACNVSASAAALNSFAALSFPSFSAFLAYAVYFLFASASPVNAVIRFFRVLFSLIFSSSLFLPSNSISFSTASWGKPCDCLLSRRERRKSCTLSLCGSMYPASRMMSSAMI